MSQGLVGKTLSFLGNNKRFWVPLLIVLAGVILLLMSNSGSADTPFAYPVF